MNEEKKSLAGILAEMDTMVKDTIIEYDKPKENDEIGTVLGIPVFIKESKKG